jgi:foldase protein PrsA
MLFAVLLALSPCLPPSIVAGDESVIGLVGDEAVSLADYQQWLLDANGATMLAQYLESRMLEHAARDHGCAATDADVEAAFDTEWKTVVKLRFGGDDAKFLAELKEGGHTRDSYRRMRSLAIRAESNLDRLAAKLRDVSDPALEQRFRADYGDPPTELSARVIHIGKFALEQEAIRAGKSRSGSTDEMAANAEKLALDLYRKVSSGDDMAQLARDFSTDAPTRESGGFVAHLTPDRFGPAVVAAARDATADRPLAPLVKDNMGFSIVRLESKRTVTLDDVRERLIEAITSAPVSGTERGDALTKLRAEYPIEIRGLFRP